MTPGRQHPAAPGRRRRVRGLALGCIGPAWLDTVLLAMNVIVYGGDGDRLLTGIDMQLATDVIAGLTGFFLDIGRLPAPPGLPTVRAFQRAQGDALLPWLRRRITG